ncbi:hypothetical protein CPB84DRAFT_1749410 [Gymnopilus junonius]|uniref:Uncharacterized protein n=1 Tax=Gymnopilus junonius TaxID=109634 RepID=A0A9P5NKG2_GYMJU|nr:hypothetical protein CPB84DRAFT_1749410 [Gymnopilus junonius]
MDSASVATETQSGANDAAPAVPSPRHTRRQTLHRSLTANSRKPLRSSPLAAGTSRSGHRRRPSTAPGPDTDVTTSRKRLSLTSPALGPFFDIHVPQRPSSVLVSLQEADVVQYADVTPRVGLSIDSPERERASLAPSGNNLMVPGNRVSLAQSSGGASARVRYSYASSSAGPSNRPVSFIIGAESDVEADMHQSWRSSYHSTTTPKPILKHPSSSSSFVPPSISPSASTSSSPTSAKSTSSQPEPGPSTKPVTTRLSRSFKDMDNSWYTFSPYATTPKFSRLGLAAPGVVMPISAKEMAKRKNSLSRGASLKTGKQPSLTNALAGKNVARRASLATATGRTSPSRTSALASGSANTTPGDKKPAPEWLSLPPLARGGQHNQSQSRVPSKASQGILHSKSYGLSPTSSVGSAASSTSSLRSSEGSGHRDRGRSSTSTAASTPLSSAPSSVSLRSWKSVRASISSMASPPHLPTFQPSTRATSMSGLSLSSFRMQGEEEISPQKASSAERPQQDLQAFKDPEYVLPVNNILTREVSHSRSLKRRKSASGLLSRVRSWRWKGKAVARPNREELVADLVIGGVVEEKGDSIREVEDDDVAKVVEGETVRGVGDAADERLTADGETVGLAVDVVQLDDKSELEIDDDGSPSTCSPDPSGNDADDELEVQSNHKSHPVGHTTQEEPRQESLDHSADTEGIHTPTSTFSLLDLSLNPEPATTTVTLIVIPIPSPNLHVAESAPALTFLQQPNSNPQISQIEDQLLSGELRHTNSTTGNLDKSVTGDLEPEKHIYADTPPSLHILSKIAVEPVHTKEKRSGSMQRLLNVIVCGASATEPSSPVDSTPVRPSGG